MAHKNENDVLHLVAWYPSEDEPFRTPFIPSHFHAINVSGRHRLIHVEVKYKPGFPRFSFGRTLDNQLYRVITLPTRKTRIVEFFSALLLAITRLTLGKRWWSGVHVHVAWPLLRFPSFFILLFGKNVLIGEHWSAYHHNFNLGIGSSAHKRMASMFSRNLPVTTVSKALASDISHFAKPYEFPIHVIPNVVSHLQFYCSTLASAAKRIDLRASVGVRFLMVASWQPIKRPLLVLEACRRAVHAGAKFQLRIIGDGPHRLEMERLASIASLEGIVTFLGPREKHFVAEEMRQADALLHASAYETFSVVCAEAISCGTPVLASRLEAIGEFIDDSNGVLVENTVEAWTEAILNFCREPRQWDHASIAANAHARFAPEVVGRQFRELYRALWQQSS